LSKQVIPQAGKLDSPATAVAMVVVAATWVAVADEQYALPKAITVLATAVPQAPFEQSRIP
jgi:hypothetical protein